MLPSLRNGAEEQRCLPNIVCQTQAERERIVYTADRANPVYSAWKLAQPDLAATAVCGCVSRSYHARFARTLALTDVCGSVQV